MVKVSKAGQVRLQLLLLLIYQKNIQFQKENTGLRRIVQ